MRCAQQSELDKHIMEVLVGCTQVRTAEEFTQLIEGPCRAVLPHEAMLCGMGGVSRQGSHIRKMLM
jgi:LuxR family transcriptional regulator, quorum-sensing system regulator CviR